MPTVGLGKRPPEPFTTLLSKITSLLTGTWKSKPGRVEHAAEFALKNGHRHVDTAAGYQNETEVGQGIKASGIPRERIS